jgi:hypothetical protein
MPAEVGGCKAMSMSAERKEMHDPSVMHVNRDVVARIPTVDGTFNLALYSNDKACAALP